MTDKRALIEKLDRDQAAIAVPLLNSYAHQYLGLPASLVQIAAGLDKSGYWPLIVSTADCREAKGAANFDEAKAMIDALALKASEEANG